MHAARDFCVTRAPQRPHGRFTFGSLYCDRGRPERRRRRGSAGRDRVRLPQAWSAGLRRSGRAHRDDGGGVCAAPRVGEPRTLSRPARRGESDSRPQLDRDGNPPRPRAGRVAWTDPGRGVLHLAGLRDRARLRVGLRTIRDTAGRAGPAVRRQAGDDRRGPAGPMGARAYGDADGPDRGGRPALSLRGGGRPPRAAGAARGRPAARRAGVGARREACGCRGVLANAPAGGRGCHRTRGRGGGDALRPRAALPLLPQGRLRALRQRLRAARVPACGPRPALGMADGGSAARRGCGGPGNTRAGVHDRHLHRLRPRRPAWRRRCDRGHLPAPREPATRRRRCRASSPSCWSSAPSPRRSR